MKAGAVPLWSYYCAPLRINYLRTTLTFDTACDPGHGWAQYSTRSGRRASGFVQVAKGVSTVGGGSEIPAPFIETDCKRGRIAGIESRPSLLEVCRRVSLGQW